MLVKDKILMRTASGGRLDPKASTELSRMERLVHYADCCEAARKAAEAIGDTFLVYMMAMAIQAAHSEMKPKIVVGKR